MNVEDRGLVVNVEDNILRSVYCFQIKQINMIEESIEMFECNVCFFVVFFFEGFGFLLEMYFYLYL